MIKQIIRKVRCDFSKNIKKNVDKSDCLDEISDLLNEGWIIAHATPVLDTEDFGDSAASYTKAIIYVLQNYA